MPPLVLSFYVNYFSKKLTVFYSFSQFIPYVKKRLFPPLSVKILHLFFPAAHTKKTPFRKRPKPFFRREFFLISANPSKDFTSGQSALAPVPST